MATGTASDGVHLRAMGRHEYWRQRIFWYHGMRLYSRRELAADGVVNVGGCLIGVSACLKWMASGRTEDSTMRAAQAVYALSLVCMLACSATYNCFAWSQKYVRALKLVDHAGILIVIAGSYTPVLTRCRCWRTLAAEWAFAIVSIAAKAARPAEVGALQLCCFLAMGSAPFVCVWAHISAALSPEAMRLCAYVGLLYTGGLVPFVCGRLEFHTFLWHVCVMAASACAFLAIRDEI